MFFVGMAAGGFAAYVIAGLCSWNSGYDAGFADGQRRANSRSSVAGEKR